MIELADLSPEIEVQEAEYRRLLGYPRGHVPGERARELAGAARAWYARHGRPWIYARQAERLALDGDSIQIGDAAFSSARLAGILRESEANAAVLAAVSAGPELEQESQRLWLEDKPDEYFFLEVFGSAVVEQLTTMAGARLCALAAQQQMAVLPHYSPGYPEWDIAEQPGLLGLVRNSCPGKIESLDSGALRPRKSLLAVFGLTRRTAGVRPLSELVACQSCPLALCQYRRMPYQGWPAGAPLPPHQVNIKALKRWSEERLVLELRADGSVEAAFRFEGSTCTNMGRALTFDYRVSLGPREDGYRIREQGCAPAAGDTGHTVMCRYLDQRESLMAAIVQEKPLLGRPLHEVLSWTRPACAAGCLCDGEARRHKWGLVLETIQYALSNRDGREV